MYINGEDILPQDLLKQVQRYVQGKEIYIPKSSKSRLRWGERNGAKLEIAKRNEEILTRYRSGDSIESLMGDYYLSYDSIRRIIRKGKKEQF